jgi:hypothetical protein
MPRRRDDVGDLDVDGLAEFYRDQYERGGRPLSRPAPAPQRYHLSDFMPPPPVGTTVPSALTEERHRAIAELARPRTTADWQREALVSLASTAHREATRRARIRITTSDYPPPPTGVETEPSAPIDRIRRAPVVGPKNKLP